MRPLKNFTEILLRLQSVHILTLFIYSTLEVMENISHTGHSVNMYHVFLCLCLLTDKTTICSLFLRSSISTVQVLELNLTAVFNLNDKPFFLLLLHVFLHCKPFLAAAVPLLPRRPLNNLIALRKQTRSVCDRNLTSGDFTRRISSSQ